MAHEAKIESLGLAQELQEHMELKTKVEQYSIKPVVEIISDEPVGCSTPGVPHNMGLFRVGDHCLSCFVERFPPPLDAAGAGKAGKEVKEPARKKLKISHHSYAASTNVVVPHGPAHAETKKQGSSSSPASPATALLNEQQQVRLLGDDVQHYNELNEAMAAGQLTDNFVSMYKRSGTIANGRCYIAVSRIAGLGLFAAQSFAKDEVVTAYGGGLRTASFVRSLGKEAMTHSRRIPNSDNVRDGKPWAAFFDCSKLDIVAEQQLDAAQRTRVEPIDVDLARAAKGDFFATTLCRSVVHWIFFSVPDEGAVSKMLKSSGLGFLSNNAPRTAQNVRIVDLAPLQDGLGTHWMFLVATRAIAAHDEILSPYNNWDPAIV
jgi:hypothetical protein